MLNTDKTIQERYFIECDGKIIKGVRKKQVVSSLRNLFKKKDISKIRSLFDGKRRVIKHNLDWNSACEYKNTFKKAGVSVRICVMMDAKSLETALINVENNNLNDVQCNSKKFRGFIPALEDCFKLGFNCTRIIPSIFNLPHSEPYYSNKGSAVGYIFSLKSTINKITVFIFFIGLGIVFGSFLALMNIESVDRYLPNLNTSNILLIMFVYIFTILFLLNFLSPKRSIKLSREEDGKDVIFQCQEIKNYSLYSSYGVYDCNNKKISIMYKKLLKQRYICETPKGSLLFSAEEEPDMNEVLMDAASDMWNELVGLSLFDVIDMVRQMGSKNKIKNIFVVRDSQGAAVAHFVLARFSMSTIYEGSFDKSNRNILDAFCLFLAGF